MEIIDAGRVRICVSPARVSGRDYIDLRVYVTDSSGMVRPTQNGILLPVERFKDISDATLRTYDQILSMAPPAAYYFKEVVADKNAPRTSHASRVSTTARDAVKKTPEQYGADSNRGYIFKCVDYTLLNYTYTFQPTKPFAVWDGVKNKWKRWESK